MSESARKKIIAGLLVVAIIWGYNNLKRSDATSEKIPTPTAVAIPEQTRSPEPNSPTVPKLVNVELEAKKPWGSDPFRVEKSVDRPRTKPEEKRKWVLSGILYNSLSPTAIVNKQQVKPGDVIGGARVVKIDQKAVTLEHNGRRITLTVTKG